jgi:DNA-binding XRE family transcriptional regulator
LRLNLVDIREPMARGKLPDLKRHSLIAKLRASGMSYRKIGERLGVTRQCVHATLKRSGPVGLASIVCCACGRKIGPRRGLSPDPVLCLSCLPSDASFGQRLRAYRVAAGLTQRTLAAQAGLDSSSVTGYESGKYLPRKQALAKLIRVLGVEWLAVK